MFPAVAQRHPGERQTRRPDWAKSGEHFRQNPRRRECFAVPKTEDVIEQAATPDVVTLDMVISVARDLLLHDLADELRNRKSRRALPHKMERVGYVPVRNPDADDGLFKIGGRRQVIYANRTLTTADQIRAARLVAR